MRSLGLILMCLAGCAARKPPAAGAPPSATPDGATDVQTVVERLPDGSTRTTTITRTHTTVPAPVPPPRPADPWPGDPLVKVNVDLVNQYRAQRGLPPLLYDARMSDFALGGSQELANDHVPHAHFAANIQSQPPGFGSESAENQGDPRGVAAMAADALASGKQQIALLLQIMMNEGPGGGHYDNIMSPALRRIGVGLFYAGAKLYLTNDFSN